MRQLSRIFGGLALAFFAVLAFAGTCTEYQVTRSDNSQTWVSSADDACSGYVGWLNSQQAGVPSNYQISYGGGSASGNICRFTAADVNPPGPAKPRSAFIDSRTGPCDPGSSDDCSSKAGTSGTINITTGYNANASLDGPNPTVVQQDLSFISSSGPTPMCDKTCSISVPFADGATYGKQWLSQVAGPNGLYRLSMDVTGSYSGASCTGSGAAAAALAAVSPAAPPPACPGQTGSVNGAVVCLPNSTAAGVNPFPSGPALNDATRGNPPAGSTPGPAPDTARAGGGASGATSGNGGGAVGGPGTGPNNSYLGKGCNDGSKSPAPACSGDGTNNADGTKPTVAGKEQANCGAPGQPKCAIDETGTPTSVDDKGATDKAFASLKNSTDDLRTKAAGADDKGFFDRFSSVFATPSLATCEPFTLPRDMGVIDPCGVVEGVRTAMAYIWAVTGSWIVLGFIRGVI